MGTGMHEIARRELLRAIGTGGAMALAGGALFDTALGAVAENGPPLAWEEGPMRWFQLAFTEDDPGNFSPKFWLDYFREIKAEGVCLSAGGGIAFYPTRVPFHGRARGLGDQDPFGEMARACHAAGMRVLARIDPHAMGEEIFRSHPEWAACGADGKPLRHWTAPDLYLTCPYTGYNFELMPRVLTEIASRYPVDGFFGNRVHTLGTCYCNGCADLYREATGKVLPENADPKIAEGARYWQWSEQRFLELTDLWNATIRKTLPHSMFISGSERSVAVEYDGKAVGERYPIAFADKQARSTYPGSYSTGQEAWNSGRFARELRAFMFDKPISNIISVGVEEPYRWKDSVQDGPEIRIWAASAIAQGSRPWITKFNGKPFDKRWMPVVSDIFRWHHRNEAYLRNTKNLARIGMVLDMRSPPRVGGIEGRYDIERHRHGFYQAMMEARLPFDEIDLSYLDPAHLKRYRVLILPNVLMMSDAECTTLRDYVKGGGRIVATHETSLYDMEGGRRSNFGLADLFGCDFAGEVQQRVQNSYLTLRHPHPALAGLDEVPRVIGTVKRVMVTPNGTSEPPPLTLVPSYQDLPMERVFTDTPTTDIPMAYCRNVGAGRVVYLPIDIDRTFAELQNGGHLAILHTMVEWAADEPQPMTVTGPGLLDIAYWQQSSSVAAHLVNYNNPMAQRGAYREAIITGPYEVSLELPKGREPKRVRLLEGDAPAQWRRNGNRLVVEVPGIAFHQVIAVDLA